ncbi:U-box domain-containing protein 6-like [Impatiens glandulifera]|uniref:U-box domain-containing protein 6-like n=1 Tax=Impatiens glandulifera TaxID=253017 RepID=UPI001FB10DA6|nr:U-box domain-containing protein 6-like [Impatiens glandulifera]
MNQQKMAPCSSNNVGSLVFEQSVNETSSNVRLWTTFSSTSFRRKIIISLRCGASSCIGRDGDGYQSPQVRRKEKSESECESETKNVVVRIGSKKLSELFSLTDIDYCDESEDVKMKMQKLEEMRRAVLKLQHGDVLTGATYIRRLTKDDSDARRNIALIGAISPLVIMLDSDDVESLIACLYALLNLGIGNDENKADIVKAGGIHKMMNIIKSSTHHSNQSITEAIVANFLSLSALDSNKPFIGSSGAIQILATTLINTTIASQSQAKQDSLKAIYNLSISPLNIPTIIESDLIPFLMNTLGDMEFSERILSILSNIVSTSDGRESISSYPDAFPILIDALNWTDSPNCQEKTLYVLMVMAHRSYRDRNAMIDAGIGSCLLELTLLGSVLAQKRASRLLVCLRMEKGKEGSASAPMERDVNVGEVRGGVSEERESVKKLVNQSLVKNMMRIVRRANLTMDFVQSESDHFKVRSFGSSSSMSLPF